MTERVPAAAPEKKGPVFQAPVAQFEKGAPDTRLFAPEGSAEGCASGECLPEQVPAAASLVAAPAGAVAKPMPMAAQVREVEKDDEPDAPPRGLTMSEPERWKRAVDFVREVSPRHGKSLSFARFLGFAPEGIRVSFPQEAAFHKATILGPNRGLVEEALSKHLGRATRLVEETSAAAVTQAPRSIAEEEQSATSARKSVIEHKVREHAAVKNVMRLLGGSLENLSVLEPSAAPAVVVNTPEAAVGDDEP